MTRITMYGALFALFVTSSAGAQQEVRVRPWVTAGLGATSNIMSATRYQGRREEGGPSVTIAGGVLLGSKYILGVQKSAWEGLSMEWGEGGSSTIATAGRLFQGIPTPVLLRVSAGRSEYASHSDGRQLFRGTVIGGGFAVVAFPRWAISPTVAVDAGWWLKGRGIKGSHAGLPVSSRQLSVTVGLTGH